MKIDVTSMAPVSAGRDAVAAKPEPTVRMEEGVERLVAQVTQKQEISRDDLNRAVEKMNQAAKVFNHALQFRVADSGRIVVKVIDTSSGEIIRQIPPEQLLDLFDTVDHAIGFLLDTKV